MCAPGVFKSTHISALLSECYPLYKITVNLIFGSMLLIYIYNALWRAQKS